MITFLIVLFLIAFLILMISGFALFISILLAGAKLFLIGVAIYVGYSFAKWLFR